MRTTFALLLALGIIMGTPQSHAADGSNGAIDLLKGGTLDQWYVWIKERGRDTDPEKVFTMENGVLHISGKEWGCVTSKKEYENYHALLEFKWGTVTNPPRVEKARDSGFLIHSFGKDGGYSGTWMNSLEVQMIEGGTGDLLVVGDGTDTYSITSPVAPEKQASSYIDQAGGQLATATGGRFNWWGRDPAWADVKGFRGKDDVEKPIGEWNRLEVIAEGGQITVLLNGVVVNHTVDCQPQKGRLQIQSEGAELFVRKVVLTPLDQPKVEK